MTIPCRIERNSSGMRCTACGLSWGYGGGGFDLTQCPHGGDAYNATYVDLPEFTAANAGKAEEARRDLLRQGWKQIKNWDENWDELDGWLSPEDQRDLANGKAPWWHTKAKRSWWW